MVSAGLNPDLEKIHMYQVQDINPLKVNIIYQQYLILVFLDLKKLEEELIG